MARVAGTIGDYVAVRRHPTVVRLQDLDSPGSGWLGEAFVRTREVESHLAVVRRLLEGPSGSGVFLIGQYGSGKSHFLAYLTLQLQGAQLLPAAPHAVALSLVNFAAHNRLEEIVADALGVASGDGDRRPAWDAMLARHPQGCVLILDELSEYLRAKPDPHAFTEDVRFLQFLGEWAQDRRFWIVAAMQESIEHTGEIDHGLYRKIKDRYPIRLLLSTAHVQSLVAEGILIKQPTYDAAVSALCQDLQAAYPRSELDLTSLAAVYPLHPATLELLAEVRDRFSQARGIVDFTVTRLGGDARRGIAPFLDEPFGSVLTPDVIIDHFRDLLELQPELQPLAQQVFPWYARHLEELFEPPALRRLAERVIKLLVLVHLSPQRELLTAAQAAEWLLLTAARVDRDRNRKVVEKILATLVERGRYVVAHAGGFRLDLRDDSGAILERLLAREIDALQGHETTVCETLAACMPASGFNPFVLPRDAWQHRSLSWSFHPRPYAVWLGNTPPEPIDGLGVCVRMPWGPAAPTHGLYCVVPAPIPVGPELIEAAALARLRTQAHGAELLRRIQQRLEARLPLFQQAVRAAWQEARLITPDGATEAAPRLETQSTCESWLDNLLLWILRRTYAGFERVAPAHGPLPKEAWLRFLRFAAKEDLGLPLADEYVRLIREAYLVPMGLLRRKGQEYVTPPNLDRNELVQLVTPLFEHQPSPRTIHEHCAQPIYGLVPDQVNLLLVFLLLQGEIDILKDRHSYRDSFETLPNPLNYDRVVIAHALATDQLAALERLCQALDVATPAHWSVLTQRRCAQLLADAGRRRVEQLQPLAQRLASIDQGKALATRLRAHLDRWATLQSGTHALQGFQQFLFEIGSVAAFVDEIASYRQLTAKIEHLLAETQRYTHLLGLAPAPQASAPEADPSGHVGPAPAFDDPRAVESWLERAAYTYAQRKTAYATRHEAWWKRCNERAIWSWNPSNLAASRHVDLAGPVTEFRNLRREAEAQRCRGLVNLDFQPRCSCGFDGDHAPLGDTIDRMQALQTTIETRLQQFFQQDAVKERLREWQRQGIEVHASTIDYLEGRRMLPEIADLAGFDDFLDGIDLAVDIDSAALVELLESRLWRPDDLQAELQRILGGRGAARLRFRPTASSNGRNDSLLRASLVEWCGRQALAHAESLPEELTHAERQRIGSAVRPEWINAAGLRRLEDLGFDDASVDRILSWVLDGRVGLPDPLGECGPLLACTAEILRPTAIVTSQQLADLSALVYRHHARIEPLAKQRWRARLDAIANAPLAGVTPLVDILRLHLEAQWVIADALGLPLVPALRPTLIDAFGDWRLDKMEVADVAAPTSTDGCYRTLLAAGIDHGFEKIDVVDELIHDQPRSFLELEALARSRLLGAVRTLLPRLDPTRPLLVFADHGFRRSADGRRYTHGGGSSLERLVPCWHFQPRREA